MTLDSWSSIVRPLMVKSPILGLFFVVFIVVMVCVLMNLITAVIVENAFAVRREDDDEQAALRENERVKELEELKAMIKAEMENAYELSVPLDVELGVGNNWLEAH